jgi:acetyl esterase/lipase
MSTLQVVLISVGGLLVLLALAYALFVMRMLRAAGRPFPFDTGAPARLLAEAIPIGDSALGHAMDVYGPAGAAEVPRPVVLFVPGDAPDFLLRKARGWGMFGSYASLCASRGWVAAVTTHRASGNYKRSEGMVSDVVEALEELRSRAGDLGLDPERVVVWTFSGSGGPVLAELLLRPVPGLRGLVSFYGFLDLAAWPMKLPQDVVQRYSLPPLLREAEALPCPVYLLHAEKDRKLMTRSFEATVQALEGRDLPVTTRVGAGLRHGFEVLDPPAQTRPEIEAGLDFAASCLEA